MFEERRSGKIGRKWACFIIIHSTNEMNLCEELLLTLLKCLAVKSMLAFFLILLALINFYHLSKDMYIFVYL